MNGRPQTDSPSGLQFHIRYRMQSTQGGPYWSSVMDDPDEAQRELEWYRMQDHVTEAELFSRKVTPWTRVEQTPGL